MILYDLQQDLQPFDIFWLFLVFLLQEGGSERKMKPLPDSVKKLIEAKTFANVATLMPDGSPYGTQTWVAHEGDTVLSNTLAGNQKHKNTERNPKIALGIVDPVNPYNMAVIRGHVKEITFDGAEDHIDKVAKKYRGVEKYEMHDPARKRILIKIEPFRVVAPWSDNPRWQQWQNRQK